MFENIAPGLRNIFKANRLLKERKEKPKKNRGMLCCHCNTWMNDDNRPKKMRVSENHPLMHLQCQCGGISHWLPAPAAILIGYGRFRRIPNQEYRHRSFTDRAASDYVPIRILDTDTLWLCTNTSTVYLFKRNNLSQFALRDLPPSKDGMYRMKALTPGTTIGIDNQTYRYDGFQFNRTNDRPPSSLVYDTEVSLDELLQ